MLGVALGRITLPKMVPRGTLHRVTFDPECAPDLALEPTAAGTEGVGSETQVTLICTYLSRRAQSLAEAGLTLPELRTGWEASSRLLGRPECPRFSQTLICQSDKSIALSAVIRLTGRPNALLRVIFV
jgi:hypothetical protein